MRFNIQSFPLRKVFNSYLKEFKGGHKVCVLVLLSIKILEATNMGFKPTSVSGHYCLNVP